MNRTLITLALFSSLITGPLASAAMVICTATCVMDGKATEKRVTVQSQGLDIQDALTDLKKSCDSEAKQIKATNHFLATSLNLPNAPKFTATQTEFSAQKACI